jgi:hypothetical protein
VEAAKEKSVGKNIALQNERTSESINTKILVASLIALALVGSIYYYIVQKSQALFQLQNLIFLFLWYISVAFALYFIRQGARLGAFAAGIIGWITMAFGVVEGQGLFVSFIKQGTASESALLWLNVVRFLTVGMVIAASHDIFHKLGLAARGR